MEDAETIETGARAAALGGLHRGRRDAEHRRRRRTIRRSSAPCSPRVRGPACDVHAAGAITKGARRRAELAPMGELHALGCADLHRRRDCVGAAGVMRARARVRGVASRARSIAQHAEDATPRRRRPHARRRRGRAGSGSRAARPRPRTSIVARDCILAATHRRALCTSCTCRPRARSSWCGRARRAACRSPPRPRRTTSRSPTPRCAIVRPALQGEPAAAHRRATSPRSRPGSPTARSTPSPPTTRPTAPRPRSGRSRRRRPGCSGSRPRSRSTLGELVEPGVLSLGDALARLSWRPGGDRRARRPRRPDRSRDAIANLCVFDPAERWVGRRRRGSRAGRATRRTPVARSRPVRHTILRGSPVVVDGEAQR